MRTKDIKFRKAFTKGWGKSTPFKRKNKTLPRNIKHKGKEY